MTDLLRAPDAPDVEDIMAQIRSTIRDEHPSAGAGAAFGVRENTSISLDFAEEAAVIGTKNFHGLKGMVRRLIWPGIANPVTVIVRFQTSLVAAMREYIASSRKFSTRIENKFAKFEAMNIDRRLRDLEESPD